MVAAAGGLPVPACKKQVNTQRRASGALGRARGEIEPGGGRGCGGEGHGGEGVLSVGSMLVCLARRPDQLQQA